MRKLTGKVKCSREGLEIGENAVIKVSLVDCSIACGPATTIVSVYPKARKFPFEFELEYDEKPILANLGGRYAVQIRIETNDKLDFITDTQFLITDHMHSTLFNHIDMHVIPVTH